MNKNIKISLFIVGIILIGLGLYHSNSIKNSRNLTFGVIVGSSGQYAFIGENYIKGVNLAEKDWNTAHPDKKINLLIEDDAFDAKKGLSAYEKFVGVDKVDGLINMTSVTIDAVYSQAKESNIPIAEGGEQGVEPADDNVFQLLPGNISTEVALGKELKDRGYKNVVVFVDNNATFSRFSTGFKAGYVGPVSEYKLDPNGSDFRSDVTKALAQNPDAIVLLSLPQQGAVIVKEIKLLSKKSIAFAFDSSLQTGFGDYKKVLGDTSILNGSLVVTIQSDKDKSFIDEYKKEYNEEPGVASDWAYDSFMLLAKTYDANHQTWINNIKNASFDGVGGKVVFDQVGVREPEFKIGTIENGELPK